MEVMIYLLPQILLQGGYMFWLWRTLSIMIFLKTLWFISIK